MKKPESPAAPLVVRLEDVQTEREAGGKAANLARLKELGVAVPEGLVITQAAFERFLDETALRPAIDALCRTLDSRSPLTIACAADTIAALIRAETLTDALAGELQAAFAAMGAPRAIVRSSAIGEDSAAASFAGQLDSIPDVTSAHALRRAVLDVWASRWSNRVLTYELVRNAPLAGMGVIVQRQIDAVISGVLFTEAPGDPERMLVEYCGGAGESLVSGKENPGRLTIARRDGRTVRLAAPERAISHEAERLSDRVLQSLGQTALSIEQAFGSPQDIEWTMDEGGTVWIVQARPITNAQQSRTIGATPEIVWSNANVNENFPEPISPLLYSIAREGYYHYFRNLGRAFGISRRRLAAMESPLRQIIGVHGARMYYNLTNIHHVLRAAPLGDRLASYFNQFVGAEEPGTRNPEAATWNQGHGIAQAAELIVIALKTGWQYTRLTRRVERFERGADAFAERTHPSRLAAKSVPELLDDFRAFLDIRCNRWTDAALADTGAMVCYGTLKSLLSRSFPHADQQSLHNTLLKALPGLVSSQPPIELWRLSRLIRADRDLSTLFRDASTSAILATIRGDVRFDAFRREFERYLEDWGFRCSAELMLTVPSFQEAPEPAIDLLKSYASMDGESPVDLLARQQRERLLETARVLRALGLRRLYVSPVLRSTQACIQLRERARLKQALLYSRLRRIVLALGARLVESGRLARPEDVFFLTSAEIDALAAGSDMFPDHVRGVIELRRAAHAEITAFTPPDMIRLPVGEYLSPCPADPPADESSPQGGMRGVGACGGRTTGRAVILADVSESHRLSPGDVLVTRQTDPGWGPVFPLISGLVMERGGMLSHGAIIAREFGIPSVVGVKDATRLIPQGGRVVIDGDRGLVSVVEGAA
jgi:pyruvate,water dikinase